MKFLILCFASIFALKPKVCIHCKYFLNTGTETKHGKCSFFPLQETDFHFLVTGIENKDYFYCSTARQHEAMCGIQGKKYEETKEDRVRSRFALPGSALPL